MVSAHETFKLVGNPAKERDRCARHSLSVISTGFQATIRKAFNPGSWGVQKECLEEAKSIIPGRQ